MDTESKILLRQKSFLKSDSFGGTISIEVHEYISKKLFYLFDAQSGCYAVCNPIYEVNIKSYQFTDKLVTFET